MRVVRTEEIGRVFQAENANAGVRRRRLDAAAFVFRVVLAIILGIGAVVFLGSEHARAKHHAAEITDGGVQE